jgi:hypothetical protein
MRGQRETVESVLSCNLHRGSGDPLGSPGLCGKHYYLLNLFGFSRQKSLCSPGCPGTHSVDQAGLELRNLPASASASQVLGLKACTTTARHILNFDTPN